MKEINSKLENSLNPSFKKTSEFNIVKIKEELLLLGEKASQCSPEDNDFSKIREAFIKIQPIIEKGLRRYIEEEESADINFSMDREYCCYFELISRFNLITESNKDIITRLFMVSSGIDFTIAEDIIKKRDLYKSKEKNINEEDHLLGCILKKVGFSKKEASDLARSWLSIEDDDLVGWSITQNLRNIRGLENFEKKSAKYLYDNFGIRCFGRYGARELKEQYEEKDNMGPYGLYFQAVMDWNGSFSRSNQSGDIREIVKENGFILRIIEASGKIDLAKRLLFLRDKYNQKIKFMYMHAHGNENVVGLGDSEGNNRKLEQEDLRGKGIQRVKDLFASNAELIISSCLTGVKGGLAEEMSKVYNVKVIASDKTTEGEPKSIEIKKNYTGDNLEFNIVFNDVDIDSEGINEKKKGTVIYNSNN